MKQRAFVLGNGRSRIGVDLNKLKNYGTIYGCNALYREFTPDFLIAVDQKMVMEICESGYQLKNQVWTNDNTRFKDLKNLNYFRNPRGWSSGPTALQKSCVDGHTEAYILGFDYYGVGNLFNNVYSDTQNYKKSNENATYYGNWIRQTETLFNEFKHVNFYRVINSEAKIVPEWSHINNLKQITYEEMWDKISK
jgi:hypothetical protein